MPTPSESRLPSVTDRELYVRGEVVFYRLFEVGYEIDLDRASELLASSAPERPRPARGEAQAIQIVNPPVTVGLGPGSIEVGDLEREVELSARLFDFGAISVRARLPALEPMRWKEFAALGAAASSSPIWGLLESARDRLLQRIGPTIKRPDLALVTEEYTVFRAHRLEDGNGRPLPTDALTDEALARMLMDESRPLSATARDDMLSPRFSYFEDDLAVLTRTTSRS